MVAGREGDGSGEVPGRVAAAAAGLYGLPLADFTAARGERARQARADGDAAAARQIGQLAKPNVVAWLANQLARAAPDDIGDLLALGASMRAAQADLDAAGLRELSGRQRSLVQSLTGQARALAAAGGQAFSAATERGLQETLHAALADEQAADQLARGQLTAGLARSGFPGIDAAATQDTLTAWGPALAAAPAPAPPARDRRRRSPGGPRPAAGTAPVDDDAAERAGQRAAARRHQAAAVREEQRAAARREQLDRARRAEASARDEAAAAGRAHDAAQAQLSRAQAAAVAAAAAIDRLEDELAAAVRARDDAGRGQRQARRDADQAARGTRQAQRRLAETTARRAELERP